MSFPKVIRLSIRYQYYVRTNKTIATDIVNEKWWRGCLHHRATPPTYKLFGVDDEGKGIYRCYQTTEKIDDLPYSYKPRKVWESFSLQRANRCEVIE